MRKSNLIQTIRYDTSTRIHIIVLYLLLASLTILWGAYFIYYSRTIQVHINELNVLKQRLNEIDPTEITISAAGNGFDALNRRSRHANIKSKSAYRQPQEEESDSLFGSFHFKVPVRRKYIEIKINDCLINDSLLQWQHFV